MKPGLRVGDVKSVTVTTTPNMRAGFDLGDHFLDVHPLYGTASMVAHMEWAARQHLLPVLEPHEEGVGLEVSLTHLKPVQLGKTVRLEATLSAFSSRRLDCDVRVYCVTGDVASDEDVLVGEGRAVQAVVLKEAFARNYGQDLT